MKKHKIIIDMTNNFIGFLSGHCKKNTALLLPTFNQPILSIEIIFAGISQAIAISKTIKRRLP